MQTNPVDQQKWIGTNAKARRLQQHKDRKLLRSSTAAEQNVVRVSTLDDGMSRQGLQLTSFTCIDMCGSDGMMVQSGAHSPPHASPFLPNVATSSSAETLVGKVDEANDCSQDLRAEVNPVQASRTLVEYIRSLEFIPVKHTFIHYNVQQPTRIVKSASSPSILFHNAVHPRPMSELHKDGKCSPCLYSIRKGDGCRQGSDCSFCHICTPDQIRKYRKSKIRDLRASKLALRKNEESSLPLPEEPKRRMKKQKPVPLAWLDMVDSD